MAAYRTILFLSGHDSERDETALKKLARHYVGANTAVYLLNVAAHHVTGFGEGTARGHIANDMQTKQEVFPQLKALCEQFGIPLNHIHIELGEPLAVIERCVRELGIELLVVAPAASGGQSKLAPLLDSCPCDLHFIR